MGIQRERREERGVDVRSRGERAQDGRADALPAPGGVQGQPAGRVDRHCLNRDRRARVVVPHAAGTCAGAHAWRLAGDAEPGEDREGGCETSYG